MHTRLRLAPLLALLLLGLVLGSGVGQTAAGIGSLHVSVIDVGQGDSILVEFPNGQDMLVDAGTRAAGPTVVSYLRTHKIKRIDILLNVS